MNFSCADCGREYPLDGLDYQCQCGGLFQLKKATGKTVDAEVSLGDKYDLDKDLIYLTGTQALVRLCLMQRSLNLRIPLMPPMTMSLWMYP